VRRLTGDWLAAGRASLGEEFPEALCAVRLLVAGREALSSQRSAAVRAREALTMPRLVLVGHATRSDDLDNTLHLITQEKKIFHL